MGEGPFTPPSGFFFLDWWFSLIGRICLDGRCFFILTYLNACWSFSVVYFYNIYLSYKSMWVGVLISVCSHMNVTARIQ